MTRKFVSLIGFLTLTSLMAFSQIPKPACVGYWQNWSKNVKLTAINPNYNVIQLAFATTVGTSLSNMTFTLPGNYTKTAFLADLDSVHKKGKVVLLSIGGASDAVRLDNIADRDQFIATIDTILSSYKYKMDGIDLDFETNSMAFGSAWTMSAPAPGQINMIEAVKSIMAFYKAKTGKKLLLTMAPETVYLMGALSNYQITNTNGGAMLPIIQELMPELDLLHCQYYNAGGANGGTYAIDGEIYHDDSDPNYITSMTESIIKGFTLLKNKGVFKGVPEEKVAIGLPACTNGAGTGYNTPANVALAVKYIRGTIPQPEGWTYTMTDSYPNLGGLMTWSINIDFVNACDGSYGFANNFPVAFELNSTDVNDLPLTAANVSLYPNPMIDLLHIKSPASNTKLAVYDMLGTIVLRADLNSENAIDVSHLMTGVYIVELKNNTSTSREKVIKK